MLKRLILIVLLTLPFTIAEEPNTFLTLVDVVTKEAIGDAFVQVSLRDETKTYFLEEDETLKFFVESGTYRIKLLVNNPATEAYDYYGESSLSIGNNEVKVIHLYPVGSISGSVKDKVENSINGASLKFECNSIFQIAYPKATDKYGTFTVDAVPIGDCKVFGTFEGITGEEQFAISKGEKVDVSIKLDNVIISKPPSRNFTAYIIGLLAFIVVFLLLKFRPRQVKKVEKEVKSDVGNETKVPAETKVPVEAKKLGQRGRDILRTLRRNEKKIVEFLMEQDKSIHLSKIHYKTGMSKGSLFRNLKSLEEKNIVVTNREGKVRKVQLSAWFLE